MTRTLDLDILLTEYSTGTLDDALALLAASYITLSPAARQRVHQLETLGGAMVNHCCDPVEMAANSRARVLAQLEECRRAGAATTNADLQENSATTPADLPDSLPRVLQNCLARQCRAEARRHVPWHKNFTGMKLCELPTGSSNFKARLVKMDAGVRAPAHSHRGLECMLVLEGGFSDEKAHYTTGDLIFLEDGTKHAPRADDPEGCLCLAITEAPVRPTRFLPRIMNIWLRF